MGYQTKSIGSGFNYYCNTFVPCDKTKTTVTLGDITVDSDAFMVSTIDFLNSDGTNHYFDDGDDKGKAESYIYIPQNYAETGVAGWYQCEDSAGTGTCYNDRVIKLGEAYCVSCVDGEEGASFTLPSAL